MQRLGLPIISNAFRRNFNSHIQNLSKTIKSNSKPLTIAKIGVDTTSLNPSRKFPTDVIQIPSRSNHSHNQQSKGINSSLYLMSALFIVSIPVASAEAQQPEPDERKSLPKIPPELEFAYSNQLTEFRSHTDIHPKITSKIMEIFRNNVRHVLQDLELPRSIKALTIKKMPDMARILERMFLQNPKSILLDRKSQSSFPAYDQACKALKLELIKDKDQAGITFSGRSIKLFSWCQEELTETAHPLVGYLLQSPLQESAKDIMKDQFKTLFNISNLLILQIACGDDISDNIQDEKLTKLFAKIPFLDKVKLAEYRSQIAEHREGRFLKYFDIAVNIWQDAVKQLETVFGKEYFYTQVYPQFLENHRVVMQSLIYSQHMNSRPHDAHITQESISENLAPNMMVECFRFLEEALVKKLAAENQVTLPSLSDLSIVQSIIRQSQKSASAANAAATAHREFKENDLSSPFPFAMSNEHSKQLLEDGKLFASVFENFIKENGYNNHFFATYLDRDPSKDFDYLSLLLLRKQAYKKIVIELDEVKKHGCTIPTSDYSISSLATSAIEQAKSSTDENLHLSGEFLSKLKLHVSLIDKFSESLMLETEVQPKFFKTWETEIQQMKEQASQIQNPAFREQTLKYVESWETFLCMYLIFKRALDGTI